MRTARVEVWGATDLLAAADAVLVARIPAEAPTHFVFQARPVFIGEGEAVAVRYLRDGDLYSQVNVQIGGEPNPSVAIMPKTKFNVGESLDFAFAGAIPDWEGEQGKELTSGHGSVSFNLEIFDPKTGERQTHHCTGHIQ